MNILFEAFFTLIKFDKILLFFLIYDKLFIGIKLETIQPKYTCILSETIYLTKEVVI